jgi:hypothetical protein
MCDTFVALPDTTVNGDIIFGEILSSLFLCSGVGHYGKLLLFINLIELRFCTILNQLQILPFLTQRAQRLTQRNAEGFWTRFP